jgi:hypothetical protein
VHLSALQKKGEGISWHYERRRGASFSNVKEGRGTILSTTSKEMCILHTLYQYENMTTSTAREGEVHLPATIYKKCCIHSNTRKEIPVFQHREICFYHS